MTEDEKGCAAVIAEALKTLPEPMQKLVKVYAEGLADAMEVMDNECDPGEQVRDSQSKQTYRKGSQR